MFLKVCYFVLQCANCLVIYNKRVYSMTNLCFYCFKSTGLPGGLENGFEKNLGV